jgi:formate dehydrogenase major subunit
MLYLPTPTASLATLKDYIAKFTPTNKEPKSVNWWSNRGKYITSYLKATRGRVHSARAPATEKGLR